MKMIKRIWESLGPYVLTVVFGLVYWALLRDRLLSYFLSEAGIKAFDKVAAIIVNYSSIMVGFVATLFSIVFTVREARPFKRLEGTIHHDRLKRFFKEAVVTNIILLLTTAFTCSGIGDSVCGKADSMALLLLLMGCSLLQFYRLFKIVHQSF